MEWRLEARSLTSESAQRPLGRVSQCGGERRATGFLKGPSLPPAWFPRDPHTHPCHTCLVPASDPASTQASTWQAIGAPRASTALPGGGAPGGDAGTSLRTRIPLRLQETRQRSTLSAPPRIGCQRKSADRVTSLPSVLPSKAIEDGGDQGPSSELEVLAAAPHGHTTWASRPVSGPWPPLQRTPRRGEPCWPHRPTEIKTVSSDVPQTGDTVRRSPARCRGSQSSRKLLRGSGTTT